MESYTIKNLTFSYPEKEKKVLNNLSFSIERGQFVTLCGPSGCGKTTLLRQLKTVLAPHGSLSGDIIFEGKPLSEVDIRTQSSKIGFVMQSPDNQIVTDKVWHELAFGLESLGFNTPAIRLKVAEMASFFGIETSFIKMLPNIGGQKQLLNLAAIMAMQRRYLYWTNLPSVRPHSGSRIISAVEKINRD